MQPMIYQTMILRRVTIKFRIGERKAFQTMLIRVMELTLSYFNQLLRKNFKSFRKRSSVLFRTSYMEK